MKKHQTYKKNAAGKSLFDERFSAEKLSELGNPLAELSRLVDFEMFRPALEAALFTEERKVRTDAATRVNKPFTMSNIC